MNRKGFTLLEVLIVVLLIGILAAAAIPQYFNALERQRVTEALGLLSAIEKAQTRYQVVNDKYSKDFSNIDLDLASNKANSNGNVTGSTLETKNFTYTLEDNGVKADRMEGTAPKQSILYTLRKPYLLEEENKDSSVCCDLVNGDEDICAIVNVDPCSD